MALPKKNPAQPTLEELRALGSAEANMWTITPPGGPAMSLSEHADWIAGQQAQDDKVRVSVVAQCGDFCVASEDGEIIRDQISAALEAGRSVEVSFAGVESLSTAFLNSAIGELLGVFDGDDLNARLTIIEDDIKPAQKETLGRVIANAKRYYADPQRFVALQRELEAA